MFVENEIKKERGIQVQQFGSDKEFIYALISLGLSKNASKIFEYIYNATEAETFDFRNSLKLSQPQISKAVIELKAGGWIIERQVKKNLTNIDEVFIKKYSLKLKFDDLLAQLEKEKGEEYAELQKKIDRLKELCK